jgi:hypothetical protein
MYACTPPQYRGEVVSALTIKPTVAVPRIVLATHLSPPALRTRAPTAPILCASNHMEKE